MNPERKVPYGTDLHLDLARPKEVRRSLTSHPTHFSVFREVVLDTVSGFSVFSERWYWTPFLASQTVIGQA